MLSSAIFRGPESAAATLKLGWWAEIYVNMD